MEAGNVKKGLRQSEQNVLVNALRGGKTWGEAKAALPRGIDLKSIDGWREVLEAEAKKAAPLATISTKIDIDEVVALRKANEEGTALVEKLNADLAALRQANEALGVRYEAACAEAHDALAACRKANEEVGQKNVQIEKLNAEIESLVLDEKPGSKKK